MWRQKKKQKTKTRDDQFTHTGWGSGGRGYLGAMNTCPSDSKLFGSRDSKSATERRKIIQEEERADQRGVVGKNIGRSSVVQRRGSELTIATVRYHGNTSVSQYGALNST